MKSSPAFNPELEAGKPSKVWFKKLIYTKNRVETMIDAFVSQLHSEKSVCIFPGKIGSEFDNPFSFVEYIRDEQFDFFIFMFDNFIEKIQVKILFWSVTIDSCDEINKRN